MILVFNQTWFWHKTLSCILLVNAVITVVSIAWRCMWEVNDAVNNQAAGQGLTDRGSRFYSSKLAKIT